MQEFPRELRRLYADRLCEMIREWVVEKEAPFEVDLERGVEWCRNAATGERTPRSNPSITLTLRINGGAHETEGAPVIRNPPIYRGPEDTE
jgi:hypothetical protein